MANNLGQQASADSSRVGHASCGSREVVERVLDARLSFEETMARWDDLLTEYGLDDLRHYHDDASELAESTRRIYDTLESTVCPRYERLRLEAAAEHDALIDAMEILNEAFSAQPNSANSKVEAVIDRLYEYNDYYDLDAAEELAEEARELWYDYYRLPIVQEHADGFDLDYAVKRAIALRVRESD